MVKFLNFVRAAVERVIGREKRKLQEILLLREQTIREREEITRDREVEISRLHEVVNTLVKERDEAVTKLDAKLDALQRWEARLLARESQGKAVRLRNGSQTGNLNDETLADFDPNAQLKRWSRQIEKFREMHLRGAQKPIAPYIVERPLYGHLYRMIIGTEEGRRWYDNLQISEVHQSQSLGMVGWGDTVFDCGCNQGFNALIYSDIAGSSGRVLAFDPYPLNIEISRFNASLNRKSNIEFVEAGLSDKETKVRASTLEQCVVLDDQNAPDLTEINLVPLDKYAYLKPDYIKIDIEGAEVDALAGATEIIKQMPAMYIEIHPNLLPRFNRKPMDVFKFISLDEYQCFINYPNMPSLSVYEMEFEIKEHCALYLVPRDRPTVIRYYPAEE